MTKPLHPWTKEKLAMKDRKAIQTILERATKRRVIDLMEMCEQVLGDMRSQQKRSVSAALHRSVRDLVVGYHFVCDQGRGVTEANDGCFWSGSWVVAESHVQRSLEYGAYVALHAARNELSYRQGKIINFRKSPRDMLATTVQGEHPQIREGIEFLIQETNEPYQWVGDGTGEKGYMWRSHQSSMNVADVPVAFDEKTNP